MLKAAFLHKTGHSAEAVTEFHAISRAADIPSHWKRRSYAALGWVLASLGDYRSSLQCSIEEGAKDPSLSDYDIFCLLVFGTRLRSEIGDSIGARNDINLAKEKYSNFAKLPGDCRIPLAEARAYFSEGNIDTAAKFWHTQALSKASPMLFPSLPEEVVSSWLAAFAISAVVGDLGDFIVDGSRWARHEAANNFAVCALHAGRLDGAVTALEEVMKSFGAPAVVDSVAASNLKTLYELCRTPDHLRLLV